MKQLNKPWSRLVEFEQEAAAIYLNFARQFAKNTKLSWFWLQMSMEEEQHAVLLKFCASEGLLDPNMQNGEAMRRLSEEFTTLEKKSNQKNLSVNDAFLIAAHLESSEINGIYSRLITPVRATSYVLRKKVAALRSDHMQTLLRAARKFGVSGGTMKKLVDCMRPEALKAG